MTKIICKPKKSLLQTIKIPTNSKFAIKENNKKSKDYYKAIYLEIEELMYNYQQHLGKLHDPQLMMVIKESKTTYKSVKNTNNITANIWVSYIDCYNIVLSCDISTPTHVIAKHERTLRMISRLNNYWVKIPKRIVEEFISDYYPSRLHAN